MKYFLRICTFILLLPFCLHGSTPAFEPTATMRSETIFLVQLLERFHYLKKPLNSLNAEQMIRDYMTFLDPQKMFFTQNDVNCFTQDYKNSLELLWRGGSLTPGFEMFQKAREVVKYRTQWITRRLDMPFKFDENVSYVYDRKNVPWSENLLQLDSFWNKRLKHEMLNEMLCLPNNILEDADSNPEKELPNITKDQAINNIDNARKTLKDRYKNYCNYFENLEPVDIQESYCNILTQSYDPHTTFLSTDSLDDFAISLQNFLVGIGAYLSEDNGDCIIKEVMPGGPAEQCKMLKAGDKILAVAQGKEDFVSIQGMKLRKSVKLIRGPKGTTIRLLIQPANGETSDRKIVSLVRDEIKIENNLASAKIYYNFNHDRFDRIGIIDLPTFYGAEDSKKDVQHTLSRDVKDLICTLKSYKVDGIILDMRRNGGGLLSEAVQLAGLFLDNCSVVQVKDPENNIVGQSADPDSCVWDGPLLILTSRFSASASEIVAGALKCHNRAWLFGEHTTHGKGSVQAIIEMDKLSSIMSLYGRLGAVKLTLQKWYLPDGQSTQLRGVATDVSLPSIYDCLPIGEADLPHALPWDCIPPMDVRCNQVPSCQLLTPQFRQYLAYNFHIRRSNLPMYALYEQQVDNFSRKYKQTEISLNLEERITSINQERQEQKQLTETFKTFKNCIPFFKEIRLKDLKNENPHETQFDLFEYEAIQQMSDILTLQNKQIIDIPVWNYLLKCNTLWPFIP